ncbi:MAG: hypothetical protein HY855_17685 [Burkholderiales bacterium]|nr:hypothetical protein [Burkholderiales bacterium]
MPIGFFAALLFGISAAAWAQQLDTSVPTGPLIDCSLWRYGPALDDAIAKTLKEMGAALDTDAEFKSAAASGQRIEVTQLMYRRQLLEGVPGCTKPVVKGFVEGQMVTVELSAVQGTVCGALTVSPTLRLAGYLVNPHHNPSGQPVCGGPRNPIPNILTLGRLTMAGRMIPGENVVSVTARGPFQPLAGSVAGGTFNGTCPTLDGPRDATVEDLIRQRKQVTTDYPRQWSPPTCRDWLAGPNASSMGVCTTAQWNRYHQRLYDEFELIIAKAEASKDPLRVYSAAYWLIEQSDPAKYTILRHDYEGLECDLIRNRIVVSYGLCVWDGAKSALAVAVRSGQAPRNGTEVRKLLLNSLDKSVPGCIRQIPAGYKDANDLLNRVMRPVPYPEVRQQILERIGGRVKLAMDRSGYGSCPYYGEAVYRLDERIWEGQMSQPPPVPDWEHDFWSSAMKCPFF